VLVAQFAHGLVTNPGWDWPTFVEYFTADAVLKALRVTVELTLYGTFFGFLPGIWPAIGRLSPNPVLQVVSSTYTWAFRSIPLIVIRGARHPAPDRGRR
jgi:polar amino acid transport system permease protein